MSIEDKIKTEFPGFYSRFKVGDKVKFRDPAFEDDKVHTVKKVEVETLNGHPWKIRIELENGVRRYDDHFILANAARNAKFKEVDRVVEIPSRFGSMGMGTANGRSHEH